STFRAYVGGYIYVINYITWKVEGRTGECCRTPQPGVLLLTIVRCSRLTNSCNKSCVMLNGSSVANCKAANCADCHAANRRECVDALTGFADIVLVAHICYSLAYSCWSRSMSLWTDGWLI